MHEPRRELFRTSTNKTKNERGEEKPQEVTNANETKNEKGEPRVRPPFIARGSARRSAPFAAPPPFEKLPKKGRSSLLTASRRASTNRERAAPPLPFTPSAGDSGGRIRREKPHRLRKSFCSVNPSRTVPDAETIVAWSVEDGVRKRA